MIDPDLLGILFFEAQKKQELMDFISEVFKDPLARTREFTMAQPIISASFRASLQKLHGEQEGATGEEGDNGEHSHSGAEDGDSPDGGSKKIERQASRLHRHKSSLVPENAGREEFVQRSMITGATMQHRMVENEETGEMEQRWVRTSDMWQRTMGENQGPLEWGKLPQELVEKDKAAQAEEEFEQLERTRKSLVAKTMALKDDKLFHGDDEDHMFDDILADERMEQLAKMSRKSAHDGFLRQTMGAGYMDGGGATEEARKLYKKKRVAEAEHENKIRALDVAQQTSSMAFPSDSKIVPFVPEKTTVQKQSKSKPNPNSEAMKSKQAYHSQHLIEDREHEVNPMEAREQFGESRPSKYQGSKESQVTEYYDFLNYRRHVQLIYNFIFLRIHHLEWIVRIF